MNTKLKTEIENLKKEVQEAINNKTYHYEYTTELVGNYNSRLNQIERDISIFKEIIDNYFKDFEKLVVKVENEGNPLLMSAPDFEHPKRKKFIFSATQEYYDLKNKLKNQLEVKNE